METPTDRIEIEKELLKTFIRTLLIASNNIAKRNKIASYLEYLNTFVTINKQKSDDGDNEDIDGIRTRSLDDLYLEVITKNHISSPDAQFGLAENNDEGERVFSGLPPCQVPQEVY